LIARIRPCRGMHAGSGCLRVRPVPEFHVRANALPHCRSLSLSFSVCLTVGLFSISLAVLIGGLSHFHQWGIVPCRTWRWICLFGWFPVIVPSAASVRPCTTRFHFITIVLSWPTRRPGLSVCWPIVGRCIRPLKDVPGFDRLAQLILNNTAAAGRKGYLWAKREGVNLRIFTDALSPPQPW
jgi:hypothetical protein